MEDGRGITPKLRPVRIRCAEKVREKRVSVGVMASGEIGGATDIHHCLYSARILGQRWVGVVTRIFQAEQQCELRARRVAERADALRIHAVFRGVGAHPTDGALHIIELRGPTILAFMVEAVIHRETDIAMSGEKLRHGAHCAFIEAVPAATVD